MGETPLPRIGGPLALPGWVEFNRRTWGVDAEYLVLGADRDSPPLVRAVLYHDRSGRLYRPPRNIYTHVEFEPTPTPSPARRNRQWLETARLLVDRVAERGLANALSLPPDIADVRPWLWAGFGASVRYTVHMAFPVDFDRVDGAVRNKVRKAERAGYACERTQAFDDVLACLAATEARQGFHHRLTRSDLVRAAELMGTEHMRSYVCRAATGEAVATRIALHVPGTRSIDWVAGTIDDHLNSGATQLLTRYVLEDLERAGAAAYDFAGANLPSVAAAKVSWGGSLRPYYTILPPASGMRRRAVERLRRLIPVRRRGDRSDRARG